METIDLDNLEKLAKAATQGEWFFTPDYPSEVRSLDGFIASTRIPHFGDRNEGFKDNARFIAAASPWVIQRLIAEIRRLSAPQASPACKHNWRPEPKFSGNGLRWFLCSQCFMAMVETTLGCGCRIFPRGYLPNEPCTFHSGYRAGVLAERRGGPLVKGLGLEKPEKN